MESGGGAPTIDVQLVERLVAAQFPHWASLPVSPVCNKGWDNRMFRLGSDMVVRLPRAAAYAEQVLKEQQWLPILRPQLPLAIPVPLALGEPGEGYRWQWSIYGWLPGEPLSGSASPEMPTVARSLAGFLDALQRIDPAGGPGPGRHNGHRGGSLGIYDGQAREAIALLQHRIDARTANQIWEAALAAPGGGSPAWLHGDISAGNLLMRGGELAAVIDFGCLAVGEPSCDLALAWTHMGRSGRDEMRAALRLDEAAWERGRGWALWKSLVTCAGLSPAHPRTARQAWSALENVLAGDC